MTRPDPCDVLKHALKPPEPLSITEWAERNIYLSPRQATSFPGYYRSELTPYVRGIFAALQDPMIRKVTVSKGAQTGLTLCGYIWLCHCISDDPGPILLVYPSADLARSASETRFMPMIQDSPLLREEISDDRDEWTKMQQRMNRCTVNWVGSNSPANLASRPVRYLFLDEVDKYPIDNQLEGSPIALAEQRAKTFFNRKIFKISTPTIPEGSIHTDYLAGDQRRYYVPCPHCGETQFLSWPQVRWPKDKPEEALYVCSACQKSWTEIQRKGAVSRGEWRSTATAKDKTHASFHLSSLYCSWTSLEALAKKFLRAKTFTNELQDFINSELGEPFVHFDNSIRDTIFGELEGGYDEGAVWADVEPYKTLYKDKQVDVVGGVDVQKGYLVATFRAFVDGGDSALIWAGEVATLETLDDYAAKYNAHFIYIDSRYRTQEILEWCATHTGYIPCKGVTTRELKVCWLDEENIDEGKKNAKCGRLLTVVKHKPDEVKNLVANLIQKIGARKWLVPRGYATRADYCAQMTAEKSVAGKWVAIPAGRPNHYWDAECLCLCGAIVMDIFKVRDKEKQSPEVKGEETTADAKENA